MQVERVEIRDRGEGTWRKRLEMFFIYFITTGFSDMSSILSVSWIPTALPFVLRTDADFENVGVINSDSMNFMGANQLG